MVVAVLLAASLPNFRQQNPPGEVKALLEVECAAGWGQQGGISTMRIPTTTRPLKKEFPLIQTAFAGT